MKTRDEILQSLATWESGGKPVEMLKAPADGKQLWFRTDYATSTMMRSIAGDNEWLVDAYGDGVVEVTIWV